MTANGFADGDAAPVRVGIVGAGPWARLVHGPVFAAGPETVLAAVWARRADAAEELAARHGATAVGSLEELCDRSEAVVFCVPPAVQAELAPRVVRHGCAVVLEKPIAADMAGAERLADAVHEAGVPSAVVLSWRYAAEVRSFLDDAAAFEPFGGRGLFATGSMVGGAFATPWRLEEGALLDLGPHVLDLLDAALGPVVGLRGSGDGRRWVSLVLDHESGAVSEAGLTGDVPIQGRSGVELYGATGVLDVDCAAAVDASAFATLRAEVAAMVRSGQPHQLHVGRGLHVQRLLHQAKAALA